MIMTAFRRLTSQLNSRTWHRSELHSLCVLLLAVHFCCAVAQSAEAKSVSSKPLSTSFRRSLIANTPDGLRIAVQEWGNPKGREIVFIHGISQCHLSWLKQTNGSLAREFRLITYDLRGHGSSDKPVEAELYQDGTKWAAELQAVLEAAHVKRPVLVGWSYGGLVIADYIKAYGTNHLAGVCLVDSMIRMDKSAIGPGDRWLELMVSDDVSTNVRGTQEFLRCCFAKQPSRSDFETMLAFNMLTPPSIRKAMINRNIDNDNVFRRIQLPVQVIHGRLDLLLPLAAARHTVTVVGSGRISVFDKSGHSPFYEEPERFNTELTAFVRQVFRRRENHQSP